MKKFELSSQQNKDGMRDIRIVLHEIYPESTFSTDGTGSQTNTNGIAWREKWTKANKDTIADKSIRVEFLDEERTEIWGHGATDFGADNIPHFENATVIGHFKNADRRCRSRRWRGSSLSCWLWGTRCDVLSEAHRRV